MSALDTTGYWVGTEGKWLNTDQFLTYFVHSTAAEVDIYFIDIVSFIIFKLTSFLWFSIDFILQCYFTFKSNGEPHLFSLKSNKDVLQTKVCGFAGLMYFIRLFLPGKCKSLSNTTQTVTNIDSFSPSSPSQLLVIDIIIFVQCLKNSLQPQKTLNYCFHMLSK